MPPPRITCDWSFKKWRSMDLLHILDGKTDKLFWSSTRSYWQPTRCFSLQLCIPILKTTQNLICSYDVDVRTNVLQIVRAQAEDTQKKIDTHLSVVGAILSLKACWLLSTLAGNLNHRVTMRDFKWRIFFRWSNPESHLGALNDYSLTNRTFRRTLTYPPPVIYFLILHRGIILMLFVRLCYNWYFRMLWSLC